MSNTEDRFRDGRHAVELVAPDAAAALDRLEAAMWHDVDRPLAEAANAICSAVNRIAPLPHPDGPTGGSWLGRDALEWRAFGDLTEVPAAALEFAEQFALDVSSMSDEQRGALFAALGAGVLGVGQAVYTADVVGRARAILDRIFGGSAGSASPGLDGTLADGMNDLIRVVPGLQGLDPVITELVRLRGARQHNCRKCRSLRSHSAFVAGADDETFAAVDDYANSSLDPAQQVALRLTDAFVWTPGSIDDALVDELTRHYSATQQIELVLDITRNAANKLAVALGADGTDVTDGYEVYDVAADGSITYGLTRPG